MIVSLCSSSWLGLDVGIHFQVVSNVCVRVRVGPETGMESLRAVYLIFIVCAMTNKTVHRLFRLISTQNCEYNNH